MLLKRIIYFMKQFIQFLKTEIQKGLPGTDVQWQMASSDRMMKNFPKIPREDSREAAILILLYPHEESIFTVFTQRHNYDGVHGGQISFPGGKKEERDKNIIDTALRETHEETGLNPEAISVINTLTPLFIPVSNIIVTPVVGWLRNRPHFKHDPEEVVFLIEADISKFFNPSIIKIRPFEIRGEMVDIRYFDYDGNVIWGATAMMLHELLYIINRGKFFQQV